ncbi:oligosaccharide flippase family protein [Flavobacterium sp.]|uniref:oligosaccharide flippase family protein n=1 Tax=Flavobacterium sp. TaxID=239 RepID=UPI0037BF6EB7
MLRNIVYIFKNQQNTNLLVYGIGQFFNLVTPILVVPYIVSVCSEEGYGKIGVGLAVSFFMMVFIDYGSDILGVKEVSVNRDNIKALEKIFITIYSAKLFLLFLVLILVSIIFITVPYFSQEKKLFFWGLPILIGQFLNPTWFLQGIENFKWITISNIASKVVYVVAIFGFIHNPSDYVYNNLFWGLGMIIANGFFFICLLKQYSFSFQKTKMADVTAYLKTNFSMFSSQIFVSLQMYFPIVLVSYFGNNTMAGQFKIIDQIIVIFKTYLLLFFNFVYPRVCFLLGKNTREALSFWKIYNGLNTVFIIISLGIIGLFSNKIVGYFNPKGVIEISNLLKIAVLIPIAQSITIPLKQLVLGCNKQNEYVRTTMLIAVTSLTTIAIITPFYSVLGVLLSLIFTEVITAAMYYRIIKRDLFVRTS